jgi:hypothetical protein
MSEAKSGMGAFAFYPVYRFALPGCAGYDVIVRDNCMSLTEARIRESTRDEDLFDLLSAELQSRLPNGEGADLDAFMVRLNLLPLGLQAMAATYQLDVSITLDDFGWHFANWHHRSYCDKTLWALRELEAYEQADLFEQAYAFTQQHWEIIGDLVKEDFDDFVEWYRDSALEKATMPLTRRMWELQEQDHGLFGYWTRYARKYPHKVALIAS